MIKTRIRKKMAPKLKQRLNRKLRIRSAEKSCGTAEKPRLCVFKSNKYVYAQVIDDTAGKVIVASNTLQKKLKDSSKSNKNIDAAKKVGEAIAKEAIAKGVNNVIFDRNGYPFNKFH